MLSVIKIIQLVLVKKFYERHAGLLFAVFYLMFGMVESSQLISYHIGLIHGSISSGILMTIVFAIWLLYFLKSVLFVEECITQPRNAFFRQINLLDKRIQFGAISYALFLTYLPVLLYSLVMIGIAFKIKAWEAAGSMIVFHLCMIGLGAWRIIHVINSSTSSIFKLPPIKWPFVKSLPLFYIALLADRFKITWLLTKVFSIMIIIGFLQIPVDQYEPRLAYLGLLTGITAHSLIIFEWRKFEDQYLFFIRALPLGLFHQFLMLTAAYAILLLPEFIVLLVQHVHPLNALIAFFLGLGIVLFAHSSLIKNKMDNDQHLQTMLWMFLLTFLLALSKLAFPSALILTGLAWWRFAKYFKSYEAAANISG